MGRNFRKILKHIHRHMSYWIHMCDESLRKNMKAVSASLKCQKDMSSFHTKSDHIYKFLLMYIAKVNDRESNFNRTAIRRVSLSLFMQSYINIIQYCIGASDNLLFRRADVNKQQVLCWL